MARVAIWDAAAQDYRDVNPASDVCEVGPLAIGVDPAASGNVRLPFGGTIRFRNSVGGVVTALELTGSDVLYLGTNATYVASQVPWWTAGPLTIGWPPIWPASSGDIRGHKDFSLKVRNALNTADLTIFDIDGADGIVIGTTAVSALFGTRLGFSQGHSINRTPRGAGNYAVLLTDFLIGKTAITAGGDTISLPEAPAVNQVFEIADESGTAAANPLTIDTVGAPLINGAANVILAANYGALTFYFNGTNYFIR